MYQRILVLLVLAIVFLSPSAFSQDKEKSQKEVIEIATAAVKEKGIKLDEVNIIYDEGGRIWCERFGLLTMETTSPNHGILKQGFLKNYRTVYFDFKEPVKDVWVFIDKDTGEVLTVYSEE